MANYDWNKLRKKFLTSSKKVSLKQFAIDNNIPYGLLRQKGSKWLRERKSIDEHKTNKIIEKTISRQIDSETEINLSHFSTAKELLTILQKAMNYKKNATSAKNINSLVKSLETIQKVQRLASGIENKKTNDSVIDEFIKSLQESDNNVTD